MVDMKIIYDSYMVAMWLLVFGMRLLCVFHAVAKWLLCSCYAVAMRLLSGCYVLLCGCYAADMR